MTTSDVRGSAVDRPGQVFARDSSDAPTVDVSDAGPASSLTPRQREAVYLAAIGLSYQQAAEVMVVSVQSYKNHMYSAFQRLGVHSRVEAMNALGLVRLP